jgi:TonB family protein
MMTVAVLLAAPMAVFAQGGTRAGEAAERSGGELTQKPKVKKEVEADYTEEALEAEVEGTVRLKMQIDAKGNVAKVEIVDGLGHGLDEAAREAVRQFEFEPAEIDGEPAPVVIPFRVSFSLPERPASLRGRVETADGDETLEGVRVRIEYRGETTGDPPSAETTTDANGEFVFEKVPPGSYRVRLEAEGFRPAETELTLESGETLEATYRVEAAPVRLRGQVREAGTRDELGGVRVQVYTAGGGEKLREVYTDGNGVFRVRGLEAGTYQLRVGSEGYDSERHDERIREGERLEVTYYLEADYYDQFSVQTTVERETESVDQKTIDLEEVRRLPGTAEDPVRAIQNLPGVARPGFSGGQLVVRGSTPQSTRTFLEGDEIPIVYHFFGGPAVISSEMIESITFHPGNYSARYGRALGGIVDLETRDPKDDRLHGFAEVDVLDATAQVEGPITDDLSFAVSARRSYVDAFLPALLPDDAGLRVAPRYYDYQGWLNWDVSEDHKLELSLYGSNDTVEALFDEDDPPGNARVQFTGLGVDNGFNRGQLRWEWRPDDLDVENEAMLSFGNNYVGFEAAADIFFRLDYNQLQARNDFRWQATDDVEFRAGTDTQIGRVTYSTEIPGLGGFGQGGQGQPNFSETGVVADDESTWLVRPAAYSELGIEPTDDIEVIPGLRVDYYSSVDQAALSPRLTTRWELSDEVTLKGGVGQFTQPPEPGQTEPNFGNPELSFQKAGQYAFGTEYSPIDFLELDATLFYRDLWDLVETTDEVRVDQESGETEPVIYNNSGQGRAYGLELLVRHQPANKFFGWIAYTLSRAERWEPAEGEWYPFEYDQTHNLTMVAGYNLPKNWDISARFRLVTGNPETPVVGSVWNADQDSYVPIRGPRNSARGDTFHQLDLRVDKEWVFDTWRLGAYLDVINAYNARNQEGTRYNFDYSESAPISGLPIIPTLGVSGRF